MSLWFAGTPSIPCRLPALAWECCTGDPREHVCAQVPSTLLAAPQCTPGCPPSCPGTEPAGALVHSAPETGVCSGLLCTLIPPRPPSAFHALHLRGGGEGVLSFTLGNLPGLTHNFLPEILGPRRRLKGSFLCAREGLPGCAESRQPRAGRPAEHTCSSPRGFRAGAWLTACLRGLVCGVGDGSPASAPGGIWLSRSPSRTRTRAPPGGRGAPCRFHAHWAALESQLAAAVLSCS